MTLLKVYNKNGYCRQYEAPASGFSDLMNEFPFTNFFSPESRYGSPRVNISEETGKFMIEMEIPGIDKKQLKMNLTRDILTISYKSEDGKSNEKFTYREFNNMDFERSFRLPESIDSDRITASCLEGILLVDLPKKEESNDKGSRSIDIS
jgi:HSP20 family protein